MPQNRAALPDMTPAQAEYVLSTLLRDKKVNARDIRQALDRMHEEIAELEARLASLRDPGRAASGPRRSRATSSRRTRSTMPPEQAHASRQLQGRYMSLIRQFPESRRGKYKKMAAKQGREAAVAAMQAVQTK